MKYKIGLNPEHKEFRQLVEKIAGDGIPPEANIYFSYRNKVAWLDTQHGRISIKSFRRPRLVNSLVYGFLRKGKAMRSFTFGLKLKELAFKTPEPIAYMERREGARLKGSYYLSKHIDATEIRFVAEHPERDKILHALGLEMARLHKAGVWMRDFSPGNVMFSENSDTPGGYDFNYVDLNRISFNTFSRKKQMKMFKTIVDDNEMLRIITDSYADAMCRDKETVYSEAIEAVEAFEKFRRRKNKIKSFFR